MGARRKTATKPAATGTAQDPTPEPIRPTPTAASREADKQERAPTFRVDLGEALPTPPLRTATDNE